MRLVFLQLTIILAFIARGANFIEQTDWSGGPGVPGPILSWDNFFDTSTDIDWFSIPGDLLLQETISDHPGSFSKDFETVGYLVSSILEMPPRLKDDDFWGNIFWDANVQPVTEISLRVRGSDTPGNMGLWSDPITEWGENLGEILNDEFAYFQYEATLATSNTSISPELYSVIITFETDSGGVWTPGSSGTIEHLNDVCFVDSLKGWAVGNNGTVLVTSDGGINWTPQTSNTPENLNSVSFVDHAYGWASGSSGTIINTVDGGDVWSLQTSGVTSELRGISFSDHNTGWAVGTGETIIATNNGGSSWQLRHSGSGVLNGVHSADDFNAMVIGDGGLVLKTADGGDVWYPLSSGVTRNLNDIFMVTPNIIYAVGNFGTIINSSNSGQTWIIQHQSKSGNGSRDTDLHSVNFVNVYTGWAVGSGGQILYSESGGEEWIFQPGGRFPDDLLGIGGINSESAVSIGADGAVILYNFTSGIEARCK
ncbi:MAG: YCF48-related protein, partial [Candidatus Fermentibacteria bacterium]|nr:YCF48-related protein [Candidatus Fermentibacteria bacterium]